MLEVNALQFARMKALAWRLALTPQAPTTYNPANQEDDARAFAAYIDAIYKLQQAQLPGLCVAYPTARVRSLGLAMAKGQLERDAILTILDHEASGGKPVGIFAASPAAARAKNSLAYGVGGVTAQTWRGLGEPFPHWCLLHPVYGLDGALRVFREKLRAAGGDVSRAWFGYAGDAEGHATFMAMFGRYHNQQA